jgi:hypothetical protein
LNCDALDDRLNGCLLVEMYKYFQASVAGDMMKRSKAESAFGGKLGSAWILRECYSRMAPTEQERVYSSLYALAEQIYEHHLDTYGEIVPERPYVHKYVRREGPDDPVLVESSFLDGLLVSSGAKTAIVSREVLVGRYRGSGPQEPQWSECTEKVHFVEGAPELAELDKVIASKKAERAERAARAARAGATDELEELYRPTSPVYVPDSPSNSSYWAYTD